MKKEEFIELAPKCGYGKKEAAKRYVEAKWHFRFGQDVLDVNSLRSINRFEVFISVLNRAYTKINMDVEHECDDDIEPDEKPEWSLD